MINQLRRRISFFYLNSIFQYSRASGAIAAIYEGNYSVLRGSEAYGRVIAARFGFVDVLWTSG